MIREPIGVFVVLLLACGTASAQDLGWPPAPVGKTGQVTCRGDLGQVVECSGTGQDGEFQAGIAWPNPRFTDNLDGTVTDNLTGLVWLQTPDCAMFFSGDSAGSSFRTWGDALQAAAGLSSGYCGLLDGSSVGEWRLPNLFELMSLLDLEYQSPALSDAAGTAKWTTNGDAFVIASPSTLYCWSANSKPGSDGAIYVNLASIAVVEVQKSTPLMTWPVRDGSAIFADGFGSGNTGRWSQS